MSRQQLKKQQDETGADCGAPATEAGEHALERIDRTSDKNLGNPIHPATAFPFLPVSDFFGDFARSRVVHLKSS